MNINIEGHSTLQHEPNKRAIGDMSVAIIKDFLEEHRE